MSKAGERLLRVRGEGVFTKETQHGRAPTEEKTEDHDGASSAGKAASKVEPNIVHHEAHEEHEGKNYL